MKNLANNWKARLLKSYSSLSIIANILVALSITTAVNNTGTGNTVGSTHVLP